MSRAPHDIPDRLLDLLADQALEGLSDVDARELETLLRQHPEVGADSFHETAAALDLGLFGADMEPMPTTVAARVQARADAWIASEARSAAPAVRHVSARSPERPVVAGRLSWAPWLVAAACLVIAAVAWFGSPTAPVSPTATRTAAERYAEFISEPPSDFVQVAWGAVGKGIELPEGFTGEVVWSDARNEGYMIFDGLPRNNPSQEQYQLWVFDATRPEATPVDGGVFDIDESGRVIVPINTKIRVREAAAFAVTVEEPGGVVVSSRDRIATLAAVERPS